MMKTIFYTTTLLLFLASNVIAKRIVPKAVPPVTTDEAVYSVPHFPEGKRSKKGGVVEACHPKTKKLLWRIQVYEIVYDQTLEKDVQDVFIRTLSLDEDHKLLIMSDETSRVFVLNLATKKVTQIP